MPPARIQNLRNRGQGGQVSRAQKLGDRGGAVESSNRRSSSRRGGAGYVGMLFVTPNG